MGRHRRSQVASEVLVKLLKEDRPLTLTEMTERYPRARGMIKSILDSFVRRGILDNGDKGYRAAKDKLLSTLSMRKCGPEWAAHEEFGATCFVGTEEVAKSLAESRRGRNGLLFLSDFYEISERQDLSPVDAVSELLKLGYREVLVKIPGDLDRIGYLADGSSVTAASEVEFGPGHEVDEEGRVIRVLKHTESVVKPKKTGGKKGAASPLGDEEARRNAVSAIKEYVLGKREVTTKEVVKNALGLEDAGPGAQVNKEVAGVLKQLGMRAEVRRVGRKETKFFVAPVPPPAPDPVTEAGPRGDLDREHPGWRDKVREFVREKDFTLFDEISVMVLGKSPGKFDRYHFYRVATYLSEIGFVRSKVSPLGKVVYHRAGRKPRVADVKKVLDGMTELRLGERARAREFPKGTFYAFTLDALALEDAMVVLMDGGHHQRKELFENHFDSTWQVKALRSLVQDGYVRRHGGLHDATYSGVMEKLSEIMSVDAILGIVRATRKHGPETPGKGRAPDSAHEDEKAGSQEPDTEEPEGPGPEAPGLEQLVSEMFKVLKEHTDSIRSLQRRVRDLEAEIRERGA